MNKFKNCICRYYNSKAYSGAGRQMNITIIALQIRVLFNISERNNKLLTVSAPKVSDILQL